MAQKNAEKATLKADDIQATIPGNDQLQQMSKDELVSLVGETGAALRSFMPEGIMGVTGGDEGGGTTPAPTTTSAPNLVSELNNIDFSKLIGGPMQAAVQAQVTASMAAVKFIQEVGFTEDKDKIKRLAVADFSYKKKEGDPAKDREVTVSVPLISIVTIPCLRIQNLDINFNVKLNSVQTANKSEDMGIKGSLGIEYGPVKLNVTASYQRTSSQGVKVEKEYSMNVRVQATQDELPAGLEKVLNLLSA